MSKENILKLQKYSGDQKDIRAQSWVKLFELHVTDEDKGKLFFYYLEGRALEWYADEIAGTNIKQWETIKQKFITRFGSSTATPLIDAQRRYLRRDESVNDYFQSKIRLLKQTSLSKVEQIQMLTEGLPAQWKISLAPIHFEDIETWANSRTRSFGRVKVNLTISHITHQIDFHILRNFMYPLLLGLDVGTLFNLHVDMKNGVVTTKGPSLYNCKFQANHLRLETGSYQEKKKCQPASEEFSNLENVEATSLFNEDSLPSTGNSTHVDALSRNPVCTFITEDKMKIAQQQADLRFVKNPQIKSGIVTIRIRGHSKAVVPDSLRAKCLHHFHDDFGHPGKNKTLKLISTYYWWPQMLRTIKDFLPSNTVASYFPTQSRVLIIPNCMLQLPLKRLRFNQISPFASNNKKPRNDIATERLSRQDSEMELNQDPTGVKSDGPTETMERRQEVRESESARERQEVTGRETTAPLADAINQLSTFLTRVKISDGAESAIPPFDGAYSATQFFQTFDRKMEDASMGEQEKLLRLPNYLVRQPLELFRKLRLADRSYFQVRQILLDLYPESSEASFAKYFAMKLTGQTNLETYYREKTAMGLQLGLPQEVILETLTEGLPFNDQRLVRVVPPENLGEWFRLVQRIHGPSVPAMRSREDQPPTMSGPYHSTSRRPANADVDQSRRPTKKSGQCKRSQNHQFRLHHNQVKPETPQPDSPFETEDYNRKYETMEPNRDRLNDLRNKQQQHYSVNVFRTISRRLVANGLHSCRPLRRLPLTPPNRRQRLEWCRARSTWMTEWHRVVFSDEARFCLSSDNRRVRVWRRRGERSNPAAIVERPTVRQRGIMVWGAIAYDSRSPLLRIQGTMTAQRYVDDVLRPMTLPYLKEVPNALYQQDNARPHTARISQQALQDVQMLPWPPYSPDLSPIEHVWDIIGRRLHALPQPRSEDELWQMVEREWRAIPQDSIRTLIDSLPRRVAACIAVRGGPTCY
ncbi:Transposase [Cordylochernes scorpioides]|uniref:Transposase n=1 Tax=Cordylochernes scorpioides TaxID=51811 RepID=A0ABY6LCZ1_9ARAC|nr:Transposase [Cordylochernes scorpioides]